MHIKNATWRRALILPTKALLFCTFFTTFCSGYIKLRDQLNLRYRLQWFRHLQVAVNHLIRYIMQAKPLNQSSLLLCNMQGPFVACCRQFEHKLRGPEGHLCPPKVDVAKLQNEDKWYRHVFTFSALFNALSAEATRFSIIKQPGPPFTFFRWRHLLNAWIKFC